MRAGQAIHHRGLGRWAMYTRGLGRWAMYTRRWDGGHSTPVGGMVA